MIKRLKKIGCCTLVAFTLVFNVSIDFYKGIMPVKGAELALAAMCDALVETFMLSLGMSYSSTTDLTTGGAALKEFLEWAHDDYVNSKNAEYAEMYEIYEQYEQGLSYGDSISLTRSGYDKLRSTVYNMSAAHISPFSNIVNPLQCNVIRKTVPAITTSNINFILDDDFGYEVDICESIYDSPCLITVDGINAEPSVFVVYGCKKDADYSLILNNNIFGMVDNITGQYVKMMCDQCRFNEATLAWDNCKSPVAGFGFFEINRANMSPITIINSNEYRVLVTTGFKVYSSREEFQALRNIDVPLTYSLYGSAAVAKEHVVAEDDTVTIPIVEPYVTAQVEDVITEAVTTYPAITEEEINDLVIEKIRAITITEEDTTTGEKTDDVTKEEDINLLYDLTGIFPFCIPFDLYEAIKSLKSTEKAPVFKIPIEFPYVGVTYVFEWDLTKYDDIIDIIKAFETLGFCVGLMYATGKLMKW